MNLHQEIIRRFGNLQVHPRTGPSCLVVGDFLLDRYILGDVNRISPEAPIPIVRVSAEQERLGGAGNVAANLVSLGARAQAALCLGPDSASQRVEALLVERGIGVHALRHAEVKTTVKARVVARNQQMLRVDWDASSRVDSRALVDLIQAALQQSPQAADLILSDYAKGALPPDLLIEVFALAAQRGVRTWVDPKHRDFRTYRGAWAITPNAHEASEASGISVHDAASAERAAHALREITCAQVIFITRADQGITVLDARQIPCVRHFGALALEVFDVSGAGDTVIAALALAMALNFSAFEAAMIANIAASVVVSHAGAVACSLAEFLEGTERYFRSLKHDLVDADESVPPVT